MLLNLVFLFRCRCKGHLLLFIAVCLFSLAGCRSPEPPEAPKTANQPPVQAGAESSPPATGVVAPAPHTPLLAEEYRPAPSPAAADDEAEPLQKPNRPMVAIIIDDMGYNQQLGRQFLQLKTRLSFSFLPYAPFTGELALLARQSGHEILVHLPMEPKEKKWQLEPGTLLVTDSPDQIRRKIEGMLTAMPHATGASNHMGSRFSEDGKGMLVVMTTLQERSFFFVDSFTSASSKGLATARRLHLPSARRHLFLDNVQEATAICRQLDLLATLAKRQGQAIGIGHPYQATFAALTQCGNDALQAVEMVGVRRLVH